MIRLQAEQGGLEVQREEAARATQRMERILKGLDLAFLFDVTGSMVSAPSLCPAKHMSSAAEFILK